MPELTEYAEPTADECGAKIYFGENLEAYCTETPKHDGPHMGFHPTQPNAGILWQHDGERHLTPAAITETPMNLSIQLDKVHLAKQLELFLEWLVKGDSESTYAAYKANKVVENYMLTQFDE